MSTSFVIETEVNPETLDAVEQMPIMGGRKGRKPVEASPEAAAADLAALSKRIAAETVRQAWDVTLAGASERIATETAVLEAKLSEVEARLAIAEQAKQKTVVIGVKINALPPVKTKLRPAKLLPEILLQAKVGQAGGTWPYIWGPTGSGKTTLAAQVAESLGLEFGHLSCCEDMGEAHVMGRHTQTGFIQSDFLRLYESGGVFLWDEMDAMNSSVSIVLNAGLGNGHVYNPFTGKSIKRHPDFICIGAGNTNLKGGNGQYTRSRQDAALADRFSQFVVDYDTGLEKELCPDGALLEKLWSMRVELANKKANDGIGTRAIKNAYLQVQAGMTHAQVFQCFANRFDKANAELAIKIGGAK